MEVSHYVGDVFCEAVRCASTGRSFFYLVLIGILQTIFTFVIYFPVHEIYPYACVFFYTVKPIGIKICGFRNPHSIKSHNGPDLFQCHSVLDLFVFSISRIFFR